MNVFDSESIVISNQWVNAEYKHIIVQSDLKTAAAKPGQFFNLLCPNIGSNKPFFRRPMSVYHSDSKTGKIEFLYKVIGSGTRALSTLLPNDSLPILGPLGKGFHLKNHYQHILIVGRGVGLATLAPLAEAARSNNIAITAILSAKNKDNIITKRRFIDSQASIIEVIDTDNSSHMTHVENLILATHHRTPIDALFTCGSSRLARLLQQIAIDKNIDGEVALEQEMACGIGVCHGCIKPFYSQSDKIPLHKRICVDGPVFDIKALIP